ncbi:hypothetical protein [Estrella lausannensis]|uniref:Putative membrane protein n=1 Tax=Estrella lausannensis TaxID=483423 RepID=A0A0H5DN08_9BACT|nr:hypothetical protein [Estrella lausannensis]CRX37581.1 putative membrane protein [Estrella lausannensis]
MNLTPVVSRGPKTFDALAQSSSGSWPQTEGLAAAQSRFLEPLGDPQRSFPLSREIVPVNSPEETAPSLTRLIYRVVWIASVIGLLAGVIFSSPWLVTFAVTGLAAGALGDFSYPPSEPRPRGNESLQVPEEDLIRLDIEEEFPPDNIFEITDSPEQPAEVSIEISSPFIMEEPVDKVRGRSTLLVQEPSARTKEPSPLPEKLPREIEQKIAHWAKFGRKVVAPSIRERERINLLAFFKEKSDEEYRDLLAAMPDKMTNVLENFPDVFAEVCTPRQIALMASYLHKTLNDMQGRAMTTLLQFFYEKYVIPDNLGAGGKLSNRAAITQFYNLLLAFADTLVFNPLLENQLKAIKLKIPASSIPSGQPKPADLLEKIRQNIEECMKLAAALAAALSEEPDVSESRKEEIRAFADVLIENPDADHFVRRQKLTDMAKHPKQADIPFLIEYLGQENIGKLWAFEAVVDNRANDPTLRLTQMFSALSPEQFHISLAFPDFIVTISRCPPSVLGLPISRLQLLADQRNCDKALSDLHRFLVEDKTPLFQKQEKMAVLAQAVLRMEILAQDEEARLRALQPLVNIEEFIENLKGNEDPVEVGKTIDRLDDEKLTDFIRQLGVDSKLQMFWTIQGRKILAKTLTLQHKARLARIYPRMSPEQMAEAAKNEGFRVVLNNAEDGYIDASISALTAEQFGIIARQPDVAWHLIDIVNKFEKRDPEKFHKLLAIAQNLPVFTAVSTTKYQLALERIRDAAEKHFVTMVTPRNGWGNFETKFKATKHISQLFKSKFV